MRWETLFGDLEAQLSAQAAADLDAEVAERVRIEVGALTLADRLRARIGHLVTARLNAGLLIRGTVVDVGSDVCLLRETVGRHALVPLRSVVVFIGLGAHARPEPSAVMQRLGLRHALRGLARERDLVRVLAGDVDVRGRIDRVGADHVDLAVRHQGELPVDNLVIPLNSVVAVWPDAQ